MGLYLFHGDNEQLSLHLDASTQVVVAACPSLEALTVKRVKNVFPFRANNERPAFPAYMIESHSSIKAI